MDTKNLHFPSHDQCCVPFYPATNTATTCPLLIAHVTTAHCSKLTTKCSCHHSLLVRFLHITVVFSLLLRMSHQNSGGRERSYKLEQIVTLCHTVTSKIAYHQPDWRIIINLSLSALLFGTCRNTNAHR